MRWSDGNLSLGPIRGPGGGGAARVGGDAEANVTHCDLLAALLEQNGCGGFIREHAFALPRRFRFDFAWCRERLACELDGKVWAMGRHNRGSGIIRDWEKRNMAVLLGWRVIGFTTDDLENRPAYIVTTVQEALGRG